VCRDPCLNQSPGDARVLFCPDFLPGLRANLNPVLRQFEGFAAPLAWNLLLGGRIKSAARRTARPTATIAGGTYSVSSSSGNLPYDPNAPKRCKCHESVMVLCMHSAGTAQITCDNAVPDSHSAEPRSISGKRVYQAFTPGPRYFAPFFRGDDWRRRIDHLGVLDQRSLAGLDFMPARN